MCRKRRWNLRSGPGSSGKEGWEEETDIVSTDDQGADNAQSNAVEANVTEQLISLPIGRPHSLGPYCGLRRSVGLAADSSIRPGLPFFESSSVPFLRDNLCRLSGFLCAGIDHGKHFSSIG
jgi:hypothetical protein